MMLGSPEPIAAWQHVESGEALQTPRHCSGKSKGGGRQVGQDHETRGKPQSSHFLTAALRCRDDCLVRGLRRPSLVNRFLPGFEGQLGLITHI